jgi:hypothetical protein
VAPINDCDLPREAIPTQWLNEVEVWDALVQRMPLTAVVRNLVKMTAVGLVKPFSSKDLPPPLGAVARPEAGGPALRREAGTA